MADPAVGHTFGANTSNGVLSISYEGETAGTTGLNGVGKLISSKLPPGSAYTYLGKSSSKGEDTINSCVDKSALCGAGPAL